MYLGKVVEIADSVSVRDRPPHPYTVALLAAIPRPTPDGARRAHHPRRGRCACRKPHPGRSSGVFVFVEDAAESVVSSDAEPGYLVRIGDRCGQWVQWSGVGDALVWSMFVVATRKSHVVSELVEEVRRMSKA
jgi:ABC-type glutathione transport system ATPase component